MANALNIDLEGKTVILSASQYKGDEAARTFICEGGFGLRPYTSGQKIFGKFVSDGEKATISGYDVERVAE